MARLIPRKKTAQVSIADMISFRLHALTTPRNMQTGLQFIMLRCGAAHVWSWSCREHTDGEKHQLEDETDEEDVNVLQRVQLFHESSVFVF